MQAQSKQISQKSERALDTESVKKDFPILLQKVNGRPLIYLDSAATSLTPVQVIVAMNEYYNKYNANIHRGVHKLSEVATQKYEDAHQKVADFIGADYEEVIFTSGTTESLNLLAYSLAKNMNAGGEIILTRAEHHSNIVPWQQIAKEKGLVVKYAEINKGGKADINSLRKLITPKTKIVALTHVSNVLGGVNNIKEIADIVHNSNALLVVDGAQAVPHMRVNMKDFGCDFYAFSGHKMLGPTGIGVLYGKKELLEKMSPFKYGGDMISEVTFKDSKWNVLPWKFEAGTPNIAGGIGLGAAVDYLNGIGMKNVGEHTKEITKQAFNALSKIEGIEVYSSPESSSFVTFNINGVHPHDVSEILNREGIAIRGGHLCAMPLLNEVLKVKSVCRASFGVYSTKEDVQKFIEGIKKVKEVFKIK